MAWSDWLAVQPKEAGLKKSSPDWLGKSRLWKGEGAGTPEPLEAGHPRRGFRVHLPTDRALRVQGDALRPGGARAITVILHHSLALVGFWASLWLI